MDGEPLDPVNGAGEATEEAQGTPVIPDAPADHPETLEETLARVGIPYGDAADSSSAESEDSAEEEDEETEEPDEPEAPSADESEDSTVEEEPDQAGWAAILAESPQRINEVPVKQRGEMVRQAIERAASATEERKEREFQQREQQLSQQFETQLQAWQKMMEFSRAVDEMRDNDPDAFREWQEKEPRNAAVYFQWKARGSQPPQVQQQQQQPQADPEYNRLFDAEVQPYIERIQGRQDIIEELDRRDPNGTIFVRTPEGLRAFKQAVDELTSADSKESAQANSRKKAAESRAKKPKADATPTGGRAGKLTRSQVANMSPDQVARLPLEQLEEAMASS